MVQSIQAHDGVMWTMRTSADGSMLATGGQDGVVRVWRVLQRENTGEDAGAHLRGTSALPSVGPSSADQGEEQETGAGKSGVSR